MLLQLAFLKMAQIFACVAGKFIKSVIGKMDAILQTIPIVEKLNQ